jgi:predicted O-methyltransferase YrrM
VLPNVFGDFVLSKVDVLNLRAAFLGFLLGAQAARCSNLSLLLDLSFSFGQNNLSKLMGYSVISPVQVREEIHQLLRILAKRSVRTLLEIGTARGGTLFLFAHVASPDALIMSIDLPAGMFVLGYESWRADFYESFAVARQRIVLIRDDSHSEKTLNAVKSALDDRSLDFLFIDGDHTYEGVKRDFEIYSKLVRPGGLIALHDIAQGSERLAGVPRFWNQIKSTFRYEELVKDREQGGYGIGLLYT